jgi:hypothetical protein
MTRWDLEAVYDEQIAPLMTKVIAVCKEHGIPMFASFAYARRDDGSEEGETAFCTTSLPCAGRPVEALAEAARLVYRNTHPSVLAFTITSAPATETGPAGDPGRKP